MDIILNILSYSISNAFGAIVFGAIFLLAYKSDIFKDILAILLILLLLIPVSFVMAIHYEKEKWVELFVCGILQIGLTYLCYRFVKYMINYHKKNKYIIWG